MEKPSSDMCVAAIALRVHKHFPLLIISNRDEFYARPTQPLSKWNACPAIYAGRDLQGGGTWLGVTGTGRWALLTNYRKLPESRAFSTSRGDLIVQFLQGQWDLSNYSRWLRAHAAHYDGFNILYGAGGEGWYFSNRSPLPPTCLDSGLYGLSNHLLDTPWQKVQKTKEALATFIASGSSEQLFLSMLDQTICPDPDLPNTGLGVVRERQLSSVYVSTKDYGTRCTSLIQLSDSDCIVEERSYDPKNKLAFRFELNVTGR